jgi:sensor histidine kinase regulating citrate/malate metabolism
LATSLASTQFESRQKTSRHVSEEDTQPSSKYTDSCSELLVIRVMHMETTRRYHITPTSCCYQKQTRKTEKNKAGKDVEKPDPCALLIGM